MSAPPTTKTGSNIPKSGDIGYNAVTRRAFLGRTAMGVSLLPTSGCWNSAAGKFRPEKVWGERGISPGKLQKPRAMVIDPDDLLYLVDITGRIQVFDRDGKYLRGWRTPESKNGRPTGMSILGGKLYVADTHYFRILVYTLDGKLLEDKSFGEAGQGPGQLGWVTDVVQDAAGNLYISEYGQSDRVQKFTREREFVLQWGTHGEEHGRFLRPQNLCFDRQDRLWVCDAGNHRLQVFDTTGNFQFAWGAEGSDPGQLSYPYCMLIDDQQNVVVCEYGNSRVQKFTMDGEPLGCWGGVGRLAGELHNPWAIAQDSRKKLYVLDSYNHRVQRFVM